MAIDGRMIFSIGIGMIVSSLISFMYVFFSGERFAYGANYRIGKLKNKLKRKLKIKKKIILSKKERIVILVITLTLVGTVRNMEQVPKFMVIGLLLGFGIVLIYQKTRAVSIRARKIKEAAILFEAIELYMKAGYSQYQAIRASRVLVDKIRPEVDMCLSYWGMGARQALEKFQEELNLEEINTLILLLINMESSGMENMQDSIGREVFSIESLHKMKSQIKIANRPLVFVIYRMLPLANIAGIVIGGLLYRTYHVLEMTGFIKF